MPIDATQPPYNCRFDWDGSNEATATRNYAGLQGAIDDAAEIKSPGIDLGGAAGDLVILPKGTGLIEQKLVIRNGVKLAGPQMYASILKMSDDFDPNSHFIDVGDATTGTASFSCGLSDMILYSRNQNAAFNKAMIYTNNAQDMDAVAQRMRIYSGNRVGIYAEIGHGGAAIVRFADITVNNDGAANGSNMNPVIILYYGSTEVFLDRMVITGPSDGSGGANHVGVWCADGLIKINGGHFENIATGAMVALQRGHSKVSIENFSGGGVGNVAIARVQGPTTPGKLTAEMITRNGATYAVQNFIGGASITSDVVGQVVV